MPGLDPRGGSTREPRGAERDQPDAAGAANPEAAEHERHALGHIGLQSLRRPERHRRRHVEHDPGRQRALGHVHPDVRLAGARRCRRVDVAHVVADLVRAQLRELGPDADACGPAVTGQRPRDEPGDRDVERLDQRLDDRTRALSGGGRFEHDFGHEALTVRGFMGQARGAGLGNGRQHPLEQLVGRDAFAERVVGEHEPVAQHVGREVADVVALDVTAAAQQREHACRLHEPDRAAGAGAELDQRRELGQTVLLGVPRRVGERDRVADRVAIDEHGLRGARVVAEVIEGHALADRRGVGEAAPDDRRLLADGRIVDDDLHQEAVELRLGQRISALGLDRVLGRHHDERQRDLVGRSADRHLLLLHHLEQRRLHLGRGAVDLVGEQEVAQHRAKLGVEARQCRAGRSASRRGRPAPGRA